MNQVDVAEFIQFFIEDVEAFRVTGLPIDVRPQSRQTHRQLDWRSAKSIDKALSNHRIVSMNIGPVGFDHQERSIGILKECVESSDACIEVSNNWLCPHLGQCIESWSAPRQGLDLMSGPQQNLCKLCPNSSGCADDSNSHDSHPPII